MSLGAQIRKMSPGSFQIAARPFTAGDFGALGAVNLFTITGPIVVEGFFGIVTVVMAGATTIALNLTGTLGAVAAPVAVATASVDADEVGTIYTLAGGVAAALTVQQTAARGVGVYSITNRQAWIPGVLNMVIGGAVNTGQVDWFLQYRPCTPQARAVPA